MRYCIYRPDTGEVKQWVTDPMPVPPGYVCERVEFDGRPGLVRDGVLVPFTESQPPQ